MTGVVVNAVNVANRYRKRRQQLKPRLRRRMTRYGAQVENEQVNRLTGGKAAGDYPVPVRTGSLRRHVIPPKVTSKLTLVVGNLSTYAVTIHEGKGSSKKHGKRPFVFDAIEATDFAGSIAEEAFEVLTA